MGIIIKQPPHRNQVRPLRTVHIAGVPLVYVDVTDRYHYRGLGVERRMVKVFMAFMEWYLKRNTELAHESRRNITRYMTYLPSGMRAWREYMPGGFATYYVHSPHIKKMENGFSLDIITRAFFSHSLDSIGLRSRAQIMSWLASELVHSTAGPVTWMSIAAGSGQPVYDACAEFAATDQKRVSLVMTDINQDMLAFAEKLYKASSDSMYTAKFITCDIVNSVARKDLLEEVKPNIIDSMGLFEYLDETQCVDLLRALYAGLKPGGILIFTNMAANRPHLHVHQRALGWPGVIPRTVHEVLTLLHSASIPIAEQSVYRASDNVYNVYMVKKS